MKLPDAGLRDLWRAAGDQGRVVVIATLASLFTIMPVGYHVVVLNVPETIIQHAMNESMFNSFGWAMSQGEMSVFWSVTIASQSLGALVGCVLVIPVTQRWGTKTGMMSVNNVFLIAGSLIMGAAHFLSFAPLLPLGRLVSGVYTGLACALVPLFVQHIAPRSIKGALSCFMHIAVCFGSALAAVLSLDFMLGADASWGLLLALPAVLGLAQMVASRFIPDTPNDLLHRGHYAQAIDAIDFYYEIREDDDDEVIRAYYELVPEMPDQMGFWQAVQDPSIRKGILLGSVVSATQIFSGSMVTISYSTSMFTSVSFITSFVQFLPALGSLVSILMTIPALQLVETTGRRPLLLKTLVLCLIADCMFLIFTLLAVNAWWASWCFALSFFLYGVGYNLGTGPVSYFIPAELVPPEAASASLGAAVAVNWLSTMLTTFSYYPLSVEIGGWAYVIFIVPSVVFLLILWRFLPETKNGQSDPTSLRLLADLGPSRADPYGTFAEEVF